MNGLIRQYFPKKSNFDLIKKSETNKVIQILNNRRQRPTVQKEIRVQNTQ
jgi:IS30 family transposase